MIKICDNSLVRPLSLLFEKPFDNSYFPKLWKKSNIIPAHKKKKKKKMRNEMLKIIVPFHCSLYYRKIFEKIIFNKMYTSLQNEKLLNPNQSGFRPSDSCTNQLLSITHEFFQSFDATPSLEVRSVF